MRSSRTFGYAPFLMVGGLMVAAVAMAQTPTPTPAEPGAATLPADWAVSFGLQQVAISNGVEKSTVLHLDFSQDGKFKASRAEAAAAPIERSGTFTAEELAYAVKSVQLLDFQQLDKQSLNIGYGKALKPGWQGTMEFKHGGERQMVEFNSLQPASEEGRSVMMNRLATVVFDLKRLTEQRTAE